MSACDRPAPWLWGRNFLFLGSCVAPLLLFSCGPGPNEINEIIECEIGLWSEDVPHESIASDGSTTAELVFGFQGFLWVDTSLRCLSSEPSSAAATLRVTIANESPFGTALPGVTFTEASEGVIVSEQVQVRLDNSEGPSIFIGELAEIVVRIEGGGYESVFEARVMLADDDPCIDTDEEPICPDDDDSADDDDSTGDGS